MLYRNLHREVPASKAYQFHSGILTQILIVDSQKTSTPSLCHFWMVSFSRSARLSPMDLYPLYPAINFQISLNSGVEAFYVLALPLSWHRQLSQWDCQKQKLHLLLCRVMESHSTSISLLVFHFILRKRECFEK